MQHNFFSARRRIIGTSVLVRHGPACFLAVITPGKGPHAFALRSAVNGKFIGWVSKATAEFIRETVRTFDAEGEPLTVTLRHKPKET